MMDGTDAAFYDAIMESSSTNPNMDSKLFIYILKQKDIS